MNTNKIQKRYSYQTGGLIKPNIQKLGDIEFDSNKGQDAGGFQIVKDIKTGKDFSVLRNNDGSYRWHDGTVLSGERFLKANQNENFSPLFKTVLKSFSNNSNDIETASNYLEKLSNFSKNRSNNKMSEDEKKLREAFATKISPFGYDAEEKLDQLKSNEKREPTNRNPYWRFYLGLDSDNKLGFSEYKPSQNKKNNSKFFTSTNPNFKKDVIKEYFLNVNQPENTLGKSKNNITTPGFQQSTSPLGNYTIGRGIDDKGDYLSVYDKWDLEPFGETSYMGNNVLSKLAPNINNLMNPFEIYDRQYLNELPQSTQDSIKMYDTKYGIIPKDNRKNKQSYSTGGNILSGISALAPLLNLVAPGVGTGVGAIAGMGATALNNKEQNTINTMPTQYKNTNAFGYNTGGDLSQLSPTAYSVDGAPNKVDGNPVNIGGQQINLDHGEMLDTKNNRVFSDKYFNPLSGKKIADEAKSIERAKKSVMMKKNDNLSESTLKHLSMQSDSLFGIQEQIATMDGKRNTDGSTVQQGQQYATGGNYPNPNAWMQFAQGFQTGPQNYQYGQPAVQPISSSPYDIHNVNYKSPLPNQLYSDKTPDVYNPVTNKLVQDRMDNTQISKLPILQKNSKFYSNTTQPNVQPLVADAMSKDWKSKSSDTESKGLFGNMTTGDKMQLAGGALSMGLKAINAFKKPQVEPYRTVDTPLTLQQLDPTNALYNSNAQYNTQRADYSNRANSINSQNALSANMYAQKLNADNQIISNYENQNKSLVGNYQDRLAQRQAMNNQSMMQTDDLNSRNTANARNMQGGFYNDIAGLGNYLGEGQNQKLKMKMIMQALKTMSPDVQSNYLKSNPELAKYFQ